MRIERGDINPEVAGSNPAFLDFLLVNKEKFFRRSEKDRLLNEVSEW